MRFKTQNRYFHFMTFGLCLIVSGLLNSARTLGDDEEFKPRILDKNLRTNDGWIIPITYYESKLREKAPVLIFLHDDKGNRLNWDSGMAPLFNEQGGYAVITVDLRKRGKSHRIGKEPGSDEKLKGKDFRLMIAQDLEAVKEFIYEEHQKKMLNMRKTSIIATGMSAPIAVVFAWRDWQKPPHNDGPTPLTSTPRGQDIRSLILISPKDDLPGLNTAKALKDLSDPIANLSILTVVGSQDAGVRIGAEKIYEILDGAENDPKEGRFQLHKSKVRYEGFNLVINDGETIEKIYLFLNDYFKSINDPWRDRESKYNK